MALEDSDSYVETSFGRNGWLSNALGNLLGLDAQTGDAAWKTDMENNNEQSAINRHFQREMADLQYQRSSPANQMRLYREAGLNPSLMFGQMSDLQTSVPAGSEASHGGAPNGQFASLLGLGPDIVRAAGQLSTIPEQKELLRAQAADAKSRVPLNDQRVLNLKEQLSVTQANYDNLLKDLDVKDSQIALNNELGREATERAIKTANDNKLFLDTYSGQIEMFANRVLSQRYLTFRDRQEALTIGRQIEARIAEMQASAKMMLSSARLSDANRRMVQLQIDNYDKTLANLKAMTNYYEALERGQNVSNELKERFGPAQAVVDMFCQVLSSITPFANGLLQIRSRPKGTQTVKTDADGVITGTATTTNLY